jgi:sugar lactone lactonase YvrE
LALDSQGRLFVADRTNNRIQIFAQDGVKDGKVTAFIPDPEPRGYTSNAEGLAVDERGNIYGAENGERDIKKYVPSKSN